MTAALPETSPGLIVVGERIGRLKVLCRSERPHAKALTLSWLCRCDCGSLVQRTQCDLLSCRSRGVNAGCARCQAAAQREYQTARARRKHSTPGKSLNRRVSLKLLRAQNEILLEDLGDYWRPQTRADCYRVPRPCPYVACKYNLYTDVNSASGSIKLNFPDLTPDEVPESCALDVADRGGTTLEDVGALMNVTRERVRQIEERAMTKLERAGIGELR